MYDAHEVVSEETPGLELILNANGDEDKGREIFADHYLPLVQKYVAATKITEVCEEGYSVLDHAVIILGNVVTKPADFFRNKDLNTNDNMQGYLFRTTKNYKTDLVREQVRKPRQVEIQDDDGEQAFHEREETGEINNRRFLQPDLSAILKQKLEFAKRAMADLPQKTVRILELVADGAPHKEIAEELRVGEKSIGSRVNRARRKLLDKIYEQNPGLEGQLL